MALRADPDTEARCAEEWRAFQGFWPDVGLLCDFLEECDSAYDLQFFFVYRTETAFGALIEIVK